MPAWRPLSLPAVTRSWTVVCKNSSDNLMLRAGGTPPGGACGRIATVLPHDRARHPRTYRSTDFAELSGITRLYHPISGFIFSIKTLYCCFAYGNYFLMMRLIIRVHYLIIAFKILGILIANANQIK